MKRWLNLLIIPLLGSILAACGAVGGAAAPTPTAVPPTPAPGTVVAATSSIPTSTARPAASGGSTLPVGTLILTQVGKPIAQLPGANRQTIALADERFGASAAPNGRYGVRFNRTNNVTDMILVDYNTDPPATKDIPQGKGLSGPGVTWKDDSSGFAFFDFPPPDNAKAGVGAIFYYDVAGGQTKQLIPAPQQAGTINTAFAFSPDGKYLLYAVGSAAAEGAGGPDSQMFVFDTTTNQSTKLPPDAMGFNQWLKDSKGFVIIRSDQSGSSQIVVYQLADLNNPKMITPGNTSDFLADLAPDGKRIAVTSMPSGSAATNQIANIFIMNLDGSSRKQLTKFNSADQTITALVWGNDGIYYSITGADNKDTTWRMDLDGANATQVAEGTLNNIIGAH